jgi:hypothetical protein
MCLLSTHDHAFAELMSQVITLRGSFLEYQIQSIWLDNATKVSSCAFNDYCMTQGIQMQHSISYVHT